MVEKEEEFKVWTPFGTLHLPEVKDLIPEFPPKIPKMDDRRADAMRHAMAIDLSSIVGWVPVVGDVISDIVEDLHFSELRKILTKPELDEYIKQDKVAPSTVAMIRTFIKVP